MWRTSGSTSETRALALLFSAAGAVLLLLCWELSIRRGIHFDFGDLRNPIRYANPICGDDFHKLHFFWRNSKTLRPGQFVKDPVLGRLSEDGGSLTSDNPRRLGVAVRSMTLRPAPQP